MKAFLLFEVILVIIAHLTSAELYTALVEMEELLNTEAVLIKTLDRYIQAEETKIRSLKRQLNDYEKTHAEASQDIQGYLANPINAYLLVKRLTTDWKKVEETMVDDVAEEFVDNITSYRTYLKFPSDEDLNGAAVALMRLQDTYKLETASVARGELNGKKYSVELTANDCFELGRQSYNNADYYHTVLWMTEAMERFHSERNKTADKADILEYLAFSIFMEGNIHRALTLTNELLEITPTHQRAIGNKVYYEKTLATQSGQQKRGEDGRGNMLADQPSKTQGKDRIQLKQKKPEVNSLADIPVTVVERKVKDDPLPEREMYEKLCRIEETPPIEELSKLHCKYVDRGNAFLKLAPVKMEEAFRKPYIVVYYDVIYDSEIATIKKLAQPRFQRATVQNYKTGELETAQYRISKSAWLRGEEHKHIEKVNQRVEDLTGLTTDTAEELQVVNYGIGGHYEPHFDFARKEETNAFKSLGTGNRIATVLFYMSDVEQGGATVFPALKLALWPTKGSAAFWFNLHPSGEGDYLTRHAACPVLTGSKWVSNKWLHERGQEFRRKCAVSQNAD